MFESQYRAESLESRRLLASIVATGTAGDDVFVINQVGTVITITWAGGSAVGSTGGLTSIEIHCLNGNDVVNVHPLGPFQLNIYGGEGNDLVNTGGGNYATGYSNDITFDGGAGADEIFIYDNAGTGAARNYLFDYGARFTVNSKTIDFAQDVEAIRLSGAPMACNYNLLQVAAGRLYIVSAGNSADTFVVGDTDFNFAMEGNVFIDGNGGQDSLSVDDSGASGNDSYIVTDDLLYKSEETFFVDYTAIENVHLRANPFDNSFFLNGGAAGTTYDIEGDLGNDTFTFGLGDVDDTMPLTIWSLDGQNGVDSLIYRDELDPENADSYNINAGSIVKTHNTFNLTVNISSFSALDFFGSAGGTAIRVDGLAQLTTIRAGGGDDVITLEDSYNTLFPTISTVPTVIDTGRGYDDLFINPDNSTDTVSARFLTSQDLDAVTISATGSLLVEPDGSLLVEMNSLINNGRIDLADNTLVRRNGGAGALSAIQTLVTKGYNAGAWNGAAASIYSSIADNGTTHALGYALASEVGLTAIGITALNPSDVVVRYTRYGDADLNRSVNFNDLLRLAQNYNGTGKSWSQGDFDYNASVNFNDLLRLAQGYGQPVLSTKRPDSLLL